MMKNTKLRRERIRNSYYRTTTLSSSSSSTLSLLTLTIIVLLLLILTLHIDTTAANDYYDDNNNRDDGHTSTDDHVDMSVDGDEQHHDCQWTVKQIPRVHVSEIPRIRDFWDNPKYTEIPIIITGLATAWTTMTTNTTDSNDGGDNGGSTIDYFAYMKEHCPDGEIPVMKKSKRRGRSWADLVEIDDDYTISEFIDYVLTTTTSEQNPDELLYGFDMSIGDECPELFDIVQIPRYFNECLLQSKHSLSLPAWPVLMMGPKGTSSAIHEDNGGLPFWMTLLHGKKYWRVLPYKANYHLTGDPSYGDLNPPAYGDPFRGSVLEEYEGKDGVLWDAFDPDFKQFPRLCDAEMHEGTLEVGEIMYIPNTALHGVQNLENTIAVSANLLSPYDKAQRRWFDRVCSRSDFTDYDRTVCDAYVYRYVHRSRHPGPQGEVTYDQYINDDFFMQSFTEEGGDGDEMKDL